MTLMRNGLQNSGHHIRNLLHNSFPKIRSTFLESDLLKKRKSS